MIALVIVLLIPVVKAADLYITLPYYAIAPGSARQVNDLIKVPNDRAFPPAGRVLLTTVTIGKVSPLEAIDGWRDPDIDVKSETELFGRKIDQQQFQQQNAQEMDISKESAAIAALRALGYEVPAEGKGALVQGVQEGSPAAKHLRQGDVIVAVDGKPTPLSDQTVAGIRSHRAGDDVTLEVEDPEGVRRTVVLTTVMGDEGTPRIGALLTTKGLSFDLPFAVTIDSAGIGGPSAGLAFTLGVIDLLTAGELTGGQKVAVTGTISVDGVVGDVGGVVQKTAAVRHAGAKYFLVPPGEFEAARAHAKGKVEVIKVATLADALAALRSLGGELGSQAQPPPAR